MLLWKRNLQLVTKSLGLPQVPSRLVIILPTVWFGFSRSCGSGSCVRHRFLGQLRRACISCLARVLVASAFFARTPLDLHQRTQYCLHSVCDPLDQIVSPSLLFGGFPSKHPLIPEGLVTIRISVTRFHPSVPTDLPILPYTVPSIKGSSASTQGQESQFLTTSCTFRITYDSSSGSHRCLYLFETSRRRIAAFKRKAFDIKNSPFILRNGLTER